jgi:hypothetical protein
MLFLDKLASRVHCLLGLKLSYAFLLVAHGGHEDNQRFFAIRCVKGVNQEKYAAALHRLRQTADEHYAFHKHNKDVDENPKDWRFLQRLLLTDIDAARLLGGLNDKELRVRRSDQPVGAWARFVDIHPNLWAICNGRQDQLPGWLEELDTSRSGV